MADRELELEVLRQFNREVLPLLVNGLLANRGIGIVKTNHTVPAALKDELVSVLKLAGAQIRRNIDITLWPPPSTAQQALAAHLGFGEDGSGLNRVLSAFAAAIVSGQESPILAALQANHLIQINQLATGPVDTLIFVGGTYNGEETALAEQLDLVLAKTAKERGITVVGVEPLAATGSYIPRYKQQGSPPLTILTRFPAKLLWFSPWRPARTAIMG